MSKRILKTPAGETTIDVPCPGNFPSFYLFALHKSGSSLLNKMLGTALRRVGVPEIAIPDVAFGAGLPEGSILNPADFIFETGYCYRGFRSFPPYLRNFDITKNKKILLVRDPRDMIVSYYFSMSQSHIIPGSGVIRDDLMIWRNEARSANINEYCLNKYEMFRQEFESYGSILGTELRIYRYEDVIFHKQDWLRDMLSYLGVAVTPGDQRRIAEENDIRPAAERPGEHIRQVTPGNYRRHLGEATIERLTSEFLEILKKFGYDGPPRTEWSGRSGTFSPVYNLGEELVFGRADNVGGVLHSGFSFPEGWGVWTVEPRARIVLRLERPDNLVVWLRFQIFARAAAPPAGFVVEVHGQQVGEFSVQSRRWGEIYERTFEIPEHLVRGKLLEIDLEIRNGPTAAELKPGGRPIGIGLHRMRVSAL